MKEKFTVSVTKFFNEEELSGKTYFTAAQWQPLTGTLHDSYNDAKAEIADATAKEKMDKQYYKIDKLFTRE